MKKYLTIGAVIAAALIASSAKVQAQYKNKSPSEITREAQERQRAIDQAGRDLQRNLSKILEEQQAQEARERQLRQEEQQARKQEDQAQRERQEEARLQREAESERRRQVEAQQQIQENARHREVNQQSFQSQPQTQASPKPNAGSTELPAVGSAAPSPLAGSPNDQDTRPEGWGGWKLVSDNIWVSFCNVNRTSKQSKPLWTWSLKNWNNREVKTVWIEYDEKGKWLKDLSPVTLKPGGSYGGWGTFTAEGQEPPAIRITKVDYK